MSLLLSQIIFYEQISGKSAQYIIALMCPIPVLSVNIVFFLVLSAALKGIILQPEWF